MSVHDLENIYAGESVQLRVGPVAVTVNGSPVALATATALEFEVRRRTGGDTILIRKTLGDGIVIDGADHLIVTLEPTDTVSLRGLHFYDLAGWFNGQRKLIVHPSRFFVHGSVGQPAP